MPPEHGQLAKQHGFLGGGDPDELNPLEHSYMRAIEDSIATWESGIAQFGASWLVEGVTINSCVVGRDQIPREPLEQPEIMTDETKGPILGFAVSTDPCLVNNNPTGASG